MIEKEYLLKEREWKCPTEGAALPRGVSTWLGAHLASALQKACSSSQPLLKVEMLLMREGSSLTALGAP